MCILKWFGLQVAGLLVALLVLFVVIGKYPSVGAKGADVLRGMLGDKVVARVEMVVINVQDSFLKLKYQMGLENPVQDWVSTPSMLVSPTLVVDTLTPLFPTKTPSSISRNLPPPTPSIDLPWHPPEIIPLNQAEDEGVWIPYVKDSNGNTVAYKAFLQPDSSRPYTLVTIVAVDLSRTRLHFVLGSLEPSLSGSPARLGSIPEGLLDGELLAAFNGGFQARHGQFGAMADGIQALPPRDGLGTLGIFGNGDVVLGEWGTDLFFSPDMVSYRQNGPLVVHKGFINIRIYNNSPEDWGYTVVDVSPTVRSGIGLSKDNHTLYYFCGPSLTMDALAKSMKAAGAYNAIQLDINNYWVLFVKINQVGSTLMANPLLPHLMVDGVSRYLTTSQRDFFFITSLLSK